jgi:hypothetical protein
LGIGNNGLRANEGRETKALNCKPITNLKEIFELSNLMLTSGFRLHAVSTCSSRHGSQENQNTNQFVRVRLLSALIKSPNNCPTRCQKK